MVVCKYVVYLYQQKQTNTHKMKNSNISTELIKMTKEVVILRDALKRTNDNYYSPENNTTEDRDLIYNNIDFLDGINWSVKRLDSYIASNKRMIQKLS